MVPTQALIINHFVLIAQLGLINTWAGIMLPQLIHRKRFGFALCGEA